jgi:hypothetical protein
MNMEVLSKNRLLKGPLLQYECILNLFLCKAVRQCVLGIPISESET